MKNLPLIKKATTVLKINSAKLPIVGNVLVLDGNLSLTDLTTSITFKNVGIDKDFCLNTKDFFNAYGFISDPAVSVSADNKITFTGGGDTFKYACDNIGDYPELRKFGIFKEAGLINESDYTKLLTASKFLSSDELRPSMMHAAIKDGYIFGTDGHKLFFEKSEIAPDVCVLLNKATLALLAMFKGPFTLSINNNYIQLENSDCIIVQRDCQERYPDCLAVIPTDSPISITVDKKELTETLKKALTVVNQTTYRIKLNIAAGKLSLNAYDIDLDREYNKDLKAVTVGEVEIYFNGRFLLDVVNEIPGKEVKFVCSEARRASIFNGNILLMPVMNNGYAN